MLVYELLYGDTLLRILRLLRHFVDAALIYNINLT